MAIRDALSQQPVRVALGVAFTIAHWFICVYVSNTPSEGSWGWYPVFLLDLPLSIVLEVLSGPNSSALFIYGVIGSLWWFFVGPALVRVCAGLPAQMPSKAKSGEPDA
jgi:hypothetical protein